MPVAVRAVLRAVILCLSLGFAVSAGLPAWADGMARGQEGAASYVADLAEASDGKIDKGEARQVFDAAALETKRENWWRAADLYEQAIKRGQDDARTWTRLARAQLGAANYWRAIGAGYRAYELALKVEDKQAALDLLATALERNDAPRDGLDVYRAAARLKPTPAIAARIAALEEATRFRVVRAYANEDQDVPALCLEFYDPLAPAVVPEDYVSVTPEFSGAVTARGKTLCIDGAAFGTAYEITVAAGLPAASGETLAADEAVPLATGDRPESVGFTQGAYILPKVGAVGVPLLSVNLDKAQLDLYRVSDRGLLNVLNDGNFLTALNGWDASQIAGTLGERVWQGEIAIAARKNQRVVTAVDLEAMRKQARPGVYVLTAMPATGAAEEWDARATQWVVVTDTGLSALAARDGLHVTARSLATAKPVAGLKIGLYARNNDELAAATTDETGHVRFDPGLLRGDGGRVPTAVMAFGAGGDFTFLDLTKPAFDLSDRGVSGRLPPGPLDLFAYADRGVYRPGEVAHITALLRDDAGNAVEALPLTARILRPDGVEVERRSLAPGAAGAYALDWAISSSARTGGWSVAFHTDPARDPILTQAIAVEEVVPAQIEASVTLGAERLDPAVPLSLDIAAKYLFGAPGAELRSAVDVMIGAAATPFPAFAAYQFGPVDADVRAVRVTLEDAVTDAKGQAHYDIAAGDLPDTPKPLEAAIRADIFEPSGRPVSRRVTVPVTSRALWLGLRPHFTGDAVAEASAARFDLVALDGVGARRAAQAVTWTLIREDWDYQWFHQDGAWNYQVVVRDRPVGSGTVAVAADQPAVIETPVVDYGRFRLEVADAAEGALTAVRFRAGWAVPPALGETPDMMSVVADKPLYQPGDTAMLRVQAPFAGELELLVATDKVIERRSLALPEGGTDISLAVAPGWGAGAYVLATAFRPGEGATRGPGRAIGLAWLGVDPAARRLAVNLTVPDKTLPRQTVVIPVSVGNIAGNAPTYVTVAAVDEGVLQLTDFATPDPVARLFGKRSLGVELRDAYGKLLDAKLGTPGALREGGDGDALERRGAPPSDLRIVALFSGMVALDAAGKATVSFDLPDYNGRLRLMAVAWNATQLGSGEAGLVVRDPVVLLSAAPRFLAVGDSSRLALTVTNLDGPAGVYTLTATAAGAVELGAKAAPARLTLATGASAGVMVPITARAAGEGVFDLVLEGPDGYRFERRMMVGVRAPRLPAVDRLVRRLEPEESLGLGPKALAAYVPGTPEFLLSLSPRPTVDVAGLLRSLDRYPYGCLEQTTSRALPLLYVAEVAKAWSADGGADPGPRLAKAVAHVLEMQRSDGAFGLWSGVDEAEPWLTAYVMDFLTRARARDVKVPDFAYGAGLAWLKRHGENRRDDGADGLASRAYALYVLAAAGVGELGATRYLYDVAGDTLPSALSVAQLGAALALIGDRDRAGEAFAKAVDRLETRSVGRDYGSSARDLAALVTLALETRPPGVDLAALATRMTERINGAAALSTQEQAWSLLASRALAGPDQPMEVAVGGRAVPARATTYSLRPSAAEISAGLRLENRGSGPVWYTGTVIGVPAAPPKPAGRGVAVSRSFFTLDGKTIDPAKLAQGTAMVAVVTGKITDGLAHQLMVVDLLPAGFAIENPRLVGAATADGLDWLPDLSGLRMTQALDDRFVAALDTAAGDSGFTVAYVVRAITPGRYAVPPVDVEDMYQAEVRANGAAGTVAIIPVE